RPHRRPRGPVVFQGGVVDARAAARGPAGDVDVPRSVQRQPGGHVFAVAGAFVAGDPPRVARRAITHGQVVRAAPARLGGAGDVHVARPVHRQRARDLGGVLETVV